MPQTVAAAANRKTSRAVENDKILRRKGLAHLCFDHLARREDRVLSELMSLRRDLQTAKFVMIEDHGGFTMHRRRVQSNAGTVQVSRMQIRFIPVPSEVATTVSVAAEFAARRRERTLTRELEEIDALWAERAAHTAKGRVLH